jgi:hypothetical protein
MEYSIDTEKYIDKMVSFVKRVSGLDINLKNPVTIQDKLCWLNIYEPMKLKTKCADKLLLHEYCKEKLGVDLCIPVIKVYNNTSEINWDELPDKFVIKCNHGSGMNIIVKDKSKLDRNGSIYLLNKWMNTDFSMVNGFEAHYHDIERKIFVEEYMNDGHETLYDYKFWCFNGDPKFYTINDGNGHGAWMKFYDIDNNELQYKRTDFLSEPTCVLSSPYHFKDMVKYAKILSEHFKFVRVDFYEINGNVYLGELTFTPGAMAFKFKSHKDHTNIGNMLSL